MAGLILPIRAIAISILRGRTPARLPLHNGDILPAVRLPVPVDRRLSFPNQCVVATAGECVTGFRDKIQHWHLSRALVIETAIMDVREAKFPQSCVPVGAWASG